MTAAYFASLATLLLSTSVWAAQAPAPAAPAANAPVEATDQDSDAAEGTSSDSSTSMAAPATSAASLPTMTTAVKKRPYGFRFYNRTAISAKDLLNDQNAPSTFNYFQGKYELTDTKSVGVRQEFTYLLPKAGAEGDAAKGVGKVSDVFLSYTDTKIETFLDDGLIAFSGRIYLPTGEDSRYVTKRNGIGYAHFFASKPVGKFDLTYGGLGVYYNQTQNNVTVDGKTTALADYEFDHYADVTYNITPKVAVSQWLEVDHVVNRTSPEVSSDRRQDTFVSITYATIKALEQLKIYTEIYNEISLRNPERDFALLRQDEVTYRLALQADF